LGINGGEIIISVFQDLRMNLTTKILNNDEFEIWDDLVRESPHGTVFHSTPWITTCSRLLNKEYRILGCFNTENNELLGGCSFYIDKKGPFRIIKTRVGMSPYGGFILKKPSSTKLRNIEKFNKEIITSITDILNGKSLYVKLSNSPEFIDTRILKRLGYSIEVLYTYRLVLSENIWQSISKNARWVTRNAIKNGIIPEKIDNPGKKEAEMFFNLFVMTSKRAGFRNRFNRDFFSGMFNILYKNKMGELWFAKTESGEVASGEVILYDNKRVYGWSAASDNILRKTAAASLLIYKIAQNLSRRFNEFDLTTANTPQLAKFMANFNPTLVPYYVAKNILFGIPNRIFYR